MEFSTLLLTQCIITALICHRKHLRVPMLLLLKCWNYWNNWNFRNKRKCFTFLVVVLGCLINFHYICTIITNTIKAHRTMFKVRIYGKSELAMLYCPNSQPQSAMKNLYRWIKGCPMLQEELKAMNCNPRRKYYFIQEVQAIIRHLGEPWMIGMWFVAKLYMDVFGGCIRWVYTGRQTLPIRKPYINTQKINQNIHTP